MINSEGFMMRYTFFGVISIVFAVNCQFLAIQGAAAALPLQSGCTQAAAVVAAMASRQDVRAFEVKYNQEKKAVCDNQSRLGDPLLSMFPPEIQIVIKEYCIHPMDYFGAVCNTIRLAGHSDYIQNIAITPDASLFVTASFDRAAKVWENFVCTATLYHDDKVYAVAISKDGKTIATGSQDQTVKVWDRNNKQENALLLLRTFNVRDPVRSVAFAANGNIVIGCRNGMVYIYEQDRLLYAVPNCDRALGIIALAPDDSIVATCDNGNSVWCRSLVQKVLLQGHTAATFGLAIAPDATMITGSCDNTAKIWFDGQCKATLQHPDWVIWVAIAPYQHAVGQVLPGKKSLVHDDNIVITGCSDNRSRMWRSNECKVMFPRAFGHVSALAENGTIVTGGSWAPSAHAHRGSVYVHRLNEKLVRRLYMLSFSDLKQLQQKIKAVEAESWTEEWWLTLEQCKGLWGNIGAFYYKTALGIALKDQKILLRYSQEQIEQLWHIVEPALQQRQRRSDRLVLTKEQALAIYTIAARLYYDFCSAADCQPFLLEDLLA